MAEKELQFEAALTRLEAIVAHLERGEAPLDESLALFEEGTRLAAQCAKKLDQAEQTVVRLTRGVDGAPAEVPMEVE